MASVIKATDQNLVVQGVAFNLDDMAVKANEYLTGVKQQASQILADANRQAETVRRQAEQDGRKSADQLADRRVEQKIAKQLEGALPAVRTAAEALLAARDAWQRHWEQQAVHLAVAIAERIVRRELARSPEITLDWVRESLELASRSGGVRIHMHPGDIKALGEQVESLTSEFSRLYPTEFVADKKVSAGGCRVETQFGCIDQQLETQLARIEQELT